MKYMTLSVLAFAGMFFSSCAVEEILAEEGSVLAVMENDDTRTAVTDEGKFTWSFGDQVWLHTTSGSVIGTLSSGAGTSCANFTFGAYFGEMTGKAVYPYNSGHGVSGNVLSVVMPASYDLGSSLSNTNAAMYAINTGGTLKFNHMAGVMRFVFKSVPAGVNKFVITLDKKINGIFTADLTADYPVLETAATSIDTEKSITLNFTALSKTLDISLYVPLPLGTYNSLGLALYDDDKAIWTYSNDVTNTISRKTLKLMPSVSMGGSIGGEIEGDEIPAEPKKVDYVDEYGVNHGPGVKIGEIVWAPVNCGYHETDFKYGKLYQWGRKYGQGYDGPLCVDGVVVDDYSDVTVPVLEVGPISTITGQHESKANVFFTSTPDDYYDWLYPQDGKLWNSGTELEPVKAEYGPCPNGWRVPTCAELRTLCQNYSSWTFENGQSGYWFSGASTYSETVPQVFFPAAGYRYSANGDAYNRGHNGAYWSSMPGSYEAYSLNFISSSVSVFELHRVNAHSVRCVQE